MTLPFALLFLATFSRLSFAEERAAQPLPAKSYLVANKIINFITYYDHLTLSESCRAKSGEPVCEARTASLHASLSRLNSKELRGGKNPGSALCEPLKGQIVFGVAANGDENSFCLFKDGSLVDNGSLYFYGKVNDEIQTSKRRSRGG